MPAKLASHLMLSRHGIYYLRIERNGIEHRKSLHTRDPRIARAAAWRFGATIIEMSTDSDPKDDMFFPFSPEGADVLEALLLKIRINQIESDKKKQEMYARIDEQTRHLLPKSQQQGLESKAPLPSTISMTVIDACKGYMDARRGQITSGTVRTWQSCFNKLIKAFGNRNADTISVKDISIELARLGEKASPSTIKKDAQTWGILWTWLIDQGYATSNPVKMPSWGRTQLVRLNQERGRERLQYSAEDLRILFSKDRLDSLIRPEEVWLPTLALFTGARLEALCRLKSSDITFTTIHFDAAHDKTGKERIIPLHPHLIAAGLVEYAQEIASHFGADSYLFPHLNDVGGRRGHYFSKIFGDQRKALGVDTGKDFHSFRVTLISHMQSNGCPSDLRRLYVGHETGEQLDVHDRNYSKANFTPEMLAEKIFPYINFEWSDWKYTQESSISKIETILKKQKRGSLQRLRKSNSLKLDL